MEKNYKKIFITNLPAFYKINLYNEIAKRCNILVFFTMADKEIRNHDFFKGDVKFDNIILAGNLRSQCKVLIKTLRSLNYEELIIGGWDNLLYWVSLFFHRSKIKSVVIESSVNESSTTGLKGLLKKIFLKRIDKCYVPGKYNADLLRQLNFKGEIIETLGVGIFNYIQQPPYIQKLSVSKFLYVGRLSPEKNLTRLINIFKKHKEWTLTIIGFGPQENELKELASSNIIFLGAVKNKTLPEYYQNNDVFILPSISETWGLVVEEALNNGLPIAISNKIGAFGTWGESDKYGVSFDPLSETSMEYALTKISSVELNNNFRQQISKLDFRQIERKQINCYI